MPASKKLLKAKEQFFVDLATAGLTLEYLKHLSVDKHYSQSMLVDLIFRDYEETVNQYKFSRKIIRNLLIAKNIRHDNKLYLKLPQEIKLQFKYPATYSIEDIKLDINRRSKDGALKTASVRKTWKHYNPKNSSEHYENLGHDKETSERMATEYRKSKSPFSKSFVKYKNSDEASQCISELSRNRGLKGLLSMRTGVSLLETKVYDTLERYGLSCKQQFQLGRYSYDIFIEKLNLIIEVNGTYWHLDPRVFTEKQLVKFPYGTILVKDKWSKDEQKISYAVNLGYKVDVLWELDLNQEGFLDEYVSRLC